MALPSWLQNIVGGITKPFTEPATVKWEASKEQLHANRAETQRKIQEVGAKYDNRNTQEPVDYQGFQERKQSLMDRMKGSLQSAGESIGNTIRDFSTPTTISGTGPAYNNLPELPKQQVQPQVPQVQPQVNQVDNDWSRAGRPAENPYKDVFNKVFGDKSKDFEEILRWGIPDNQGYGINYGGENLSFNPTGVNYNENGTRDIGLFQINEDTYKDFSRRYPDKLRQYGINSYEDLFDPELNAYMAKIIYDEQGLGAWYGSNYYKNSK